MQMAFFLGGPGKAKTLHIDCHDARPVPGRHAIRPSLRENAGKNTPDKNTEYE
ncbi:hypothetical protein [Castellaniella sp. S9]|uniref:hypothetical protein n=1 Tax=Castellaniella sp. S9 TaxID=2993652 RepID=UPI0022B38916|nr:hypothetical protein [Castellaniella sp. S9]